MRRQTIITSWPGLLFLAACLVLFSGCPDEPPASTNNAVPEDMPTDMMTTPVDMPADMPPVDMPPVDMGPPTCETSDDCTGDYAGWECIDGLCTDCDSGELGCVCRANGTCEVGSRCDDTTALCVECNDGELDCPCGDAGCGDGLKCERDVCVEDTCEAGALDCQCDENDDCTGDLYCDGMMVCRACTSDIEGCACEADGTCISEDLYCDDTDDTCVACPEDDRPIGCACDQDTDCENTLACDDTDRLCREKQTCADLCLPFQVCDESLAGDPTCVPDTCEDGYTWDGAACVLTSSLESCDGANGTTDKTMECLMMNQVCVETTNGAACVSSCDNIGQDCRDTEYRDCTEYVGETDAECGACLPGYVEDPMTMSCDVDINLNCSAFDAVNSILPTCQARNQNCVEIGGGGATCGDCLTGFIFDPGSNACVERSACNGDYCGTDEYCNFPELGGPPSCEAKRCADGQAYNADMDVCVVCSQTCADGAYPLAIDGACQCNEVVFCSYQYDGTGDRCQVAECPAGEAKTPAGQCKTCQNTCANLEGARNRLWPTTDVNGNCICETLEGYYRPYGGQGEPLSCDKDGDGWINDTAEAAYNTAVTASDDAVLANFRCDRRRVDRFTLQNEWGQQRHVSLCGNDLVDYAPGNQPACNEPGGFTEITLFELDALDDDSQITSDNTNFPQYGSRKLGAAEVNSLTKACVTQTADFNLNAVEDIAEEHAIEKNRINGLIFTGDNADEKFFFHSMSYFIETHRSYYVEPTNYALPGSYVIAERSRCDPSWSISYNQGGGYWQNCSRSRRGDFLYGGSHNGFDFAHWGCSGEALGSCALAPPPTDASLDDLDGDNIADHGVCDRTDPMPDEPWRGMTHHSQFQCVVLKNTPTPGRNYELAVADVYVDGEANPTLYEFNNCEAEDCSMVMGNCAETSTQGVYQPLVTETSCIPTERNFVSQDDVGWVSMRYTPEGSTPSLTRPYVRGCIDESFGTVNTDHWKNLCSGYARDPDSALVAGNPGAFGKIICSCNRYYGGADCEVACPERIGPVLATNNDNCQTANNNLCEDGLEGATASTCAAGTDLSDCGTRYAVSTSFLHVGDRDRGYSADINAEYACGDADNYCSLHPPVPAESFPGGRRGYWMCASNDLTRTYDANGMDYPFLEGTNGSQQTYSLEGEIKTVPVKRDLLEEQNCTTNCYSLF